MYNGVIQFQIADLVALMTHYTDGLVPKDLEVLNFGPSMYFNGWYGIQVEVPKEWPGARIVPGTNEYEPFHFRFEGNKILTMNKKSEPQEIKDFDPASDPGRQ